MYQHHARDTFNRPFSLPVRLEWDRLIRLDRHVTAATAALGAACVGIWCLITLTPGYLPTWGSHGLRWTVLAAIVAYLLYRVCFYTHEQMQLATERAAGADAPYGPELSGPVAWLAVPLSLPLWPALRTAFLTNDAHALATPETAAHVCFALLAIGFVMSAAWLAQLWFGIAHRCLLRSQERELDEALADALHPDNPH